MLTKQTQILFDPTEYERLTTLAHQHKTSVGNLVRKAIRITYFVKKKKSEKKKLPSSIFGAWKNHPLKDEALMNLLSGPGLSLNHD